MTLLFFVNPLNKWRFLVYLTWQGHLIARIQDGRLYYLKIIWYIRQGEIWRRTTDTNCPLSTSIVIMCISLTRPFCTVWHKCDIMDWLYSPLPSVQYSSADHSVNSRTNNFLPENIYSLFSETARGQIWNHETKGKHTKQKWFGRNNIELNWRWARYNIENNINED